ncbi:MULTISPECIES: hypothetical protein [Nonomuraea]|uniref:DUF2178 domain-containing protein n=1 Tax=Nonomuraea mangrovi TaxID=2316207 RepID=A0ABW4T4V4_9ACTN
MSTEEKRVWIYAVIAVGVPVVYFATILRQVASTDVAHIAYVWPLLTAIGVAVAVNVVASIVTAIAAPREANLKDERDTDIHRYGQRAEYYVLAVGSVAVLGLTLAKFEHFWIANALYLAFVLSALASAIVKIVAYRRGF